MTNSSDYLNQAVAAAGVLTSNWFTPTTPGQWVPEDYWRTPTICTQLVDLMSQTDQVDYTSTLENAREAGECCLTNCGYYDDLTCWSRFFMAAYTYFEGQGNATLAKPYLEDAVTVCQQLSTAWNDWDSPQYCGGGVWWKREYFPGHFSGNNFKASNATLGFMEVALDLYFVFEDPSYLAMGQKAWDWLASYKFVLDNGLVWGGLNLSCQLDPDNVPVVGLQGNPLGPLWNLYRATKDPQYLDVADRIIEGTRTLMVWSGTEILEASDDAEWASKSDEWKRDNSGETPFKGNFCNYLGDYAKNLAGLDDPVRQKQAASYGELLRVNADAVWKNFPGTMFSMDWHTADPNYQPIPDADVVNGSLQYSGLAALAGAAKTSV